jgi:hypothetical protein
VCMPWSACACMLASACTQHYPLVEVVRLALRMALHGVAWCCMVLHGVAWCCMVLHDPLVEVARLALRMQHVCRTWSACACLPAGMHAARVQCSVRITPTRAHMHPHAPPCTHLRERVCDLGLYQASQALDLVLLAQRRDVVLEGVRHVAVLRGFTQRERETSLQENSGRWQA